MTSTPLRPYELPPFELVKLIQPAFAPSSLPGAASPETLSLAAFQSPASPPQSHHAGPSSPPSTAQNRQDPSLSGRLSQLVNKGTASFSPPSTASSTAARLFSSSPSASTSASASASGVASPRGTEALDSQKLGPAQSILASGNDALNTSNTGDAARKNVPQSIRSVQAGTESIWIAGNEGSVAVWQLDVSRASSKGKNRAQDDPTVAGTAEEVSYETRAWSILGCNS